MERYSGVSLRKFRFSRSIFSLSSPFILNKSQSITEQFENSVTSVFCPSFDRRNFLVSLPCYTSAVQSNSVLNGATLQTMLGRWNCCTIHSTIMKPLFYRSLLQKWMKAGCKFELTQGLKWVFSSITIKVTFCFSIRRCACKRKTNLQKNGFVCTIWVKIWITRNHNHFINNLVLTSTL